MCPIESLNLVGDLYYVRLHDQQISISSTHIGKRKIALIFNKKNKQHTRIGKIFYNQVNFKLLC